MDSKISVAARRIWFKCHTPTEWLIGSDAAYVGNSTSIKPNDENGAVGFKKATNQQITVTVDRANTYNRCPTRQIETLGAISDYPEAAVTIGNDKRAGRPSASDGATCVA